MEAESLAYEQTIKVRWCWQFAHFVRRSSTVPPRECCTTKAAANHMVGLIASPPRILGQPQVCTRYSRMTLRGACFFLDVVRMFCKGLTEEVESLRVFSGERDHANEKLAALEAANAQLQDQQETQVSRVARETMGPLCLYRAAQYFSAGVKINSKRWQYHPYRVKKHGSELRFFACVRVLKRD